MAHRNVILPLLAAALAGCASVENAVPTVETVASRGGTQRRSQLSEGRLIYTTKCARCHRPEPIRKYSAARWEGILAEMLNETKLTTAEAASLREYVMAAVKTGA